MIADIYEALELMRFYKPIYLVILMETGSHKQAIEAIKYLMKMEK